MDQHEIYDIQSETEVIDNNQNSLFVKIKRLQKETIEINEQLIDTYLPDTTNNESLIKKIDSLDQKYNEISLIQEMNLADLGNIRAEMIDMQKNKADKKNLRSDFDSNLLFELRLIRAEIEVIKEKQKNQDGKIEEIRHLRGNDLKSIQKLCEDVSELKKNQEEQNTKNNNNNIALEDFKNHKEKMVEEMSSIRGELLENKKKQEIHELFNQEVIKEFQALHREMTSLGEKDYDERRKKIIPIEKEIVGTWKPSSLHNYPHFPKPGESIRKSQWLTGHLVYSLRMDQLHWKLIVITETLRDTVKETTVQLGEQMNYSDHSETWTFENNHLIVIFKNKTDQSVIKKFFQFIVDGKLHIIYHNLVDDVTGTRIYERVI